mmetsp:Transcript_10139/g.35291  ORF Transcript_10139/g.35291 Transcript_10139/m.35291 type:complete len:214 (-) Transcript_10139:1642-2283(-)
MVSIAFPSLSSHELGRASASSCMIIACSLLRATLTAAGDRSTSLRGAQMSSTRSPTESCTAASSPSRPSHSSCTGSSLSTTHSSPLATPAASSGAASRSRRREWLAGSSFTSMAPPLTATTSTGASSSSSHAPHMSDAKDGARMGEHSHLGMAPTPLKPCAGQSLACSKRRTGSCAVSACSFVSLTPHWNESMNLAHATCISTYLEEPMSDSL